MINRLLKDLSRRAPYPAVLAAYYARYWLPQLVDARRSAATVGIPWFWELDPKSLKTSDTVFILGSGESINQISEAQWSIIKSHDSIGFNFWPVHSHVPTLYMFEAINHHYADGWGREVISKYVEMAAAREDYRDVPKLISDYRVARRYHWDQLPEHWKENCFHLPTIPTLTRNAEELRFAISALKRLGIFGRQQSSRRVLFKYRATLSLAYSFALYLGYRDVVLCGFDMKHSRYFYQDETRYPHFSGFTSSPPMQGGHASVAPVPEMMPVDEVVLEMQRQLGNEDLGVLYCDRSESGFSSRLPVYFRE